MHVFVSIDIEGVAGVNHASQVLRGSDDYPAARKLMTDEASAAIAGSFEGGATRVVVNDSHGDMRNLLPEALDPRGEFIIGGPKVPQGMVQGLDDSFGIAMFIGYHARAGTEAAILDHTYSSATIYDLRINGESWGEADLNAAIAGTHGVAVGLLSGDDKACAQASERIPGIRTVQVKQALGRGAAISLHPKTAREAISKAAAEVTRDAKAFQPFVPTGPFVLEVDLWNTACAELASVVPGTERIGPRNLRFEADNIRDITRCRGAWIGLAGGAAPRHGGG